MEEVTQIEEVTQMEEVTQVEFDLFSGPLPSIDDLSALAMLVHAEESNLYKFTELLDENLSKSDKAANLVNGIALHILGKNRKALEKLEKADDCQQKFLYLAYVNRAMKNHDQAIENFTNAKADAVFTNFLKAATYRDAGNFDKAMKMLAKNENKDAVKAQYHYHLGRIQEDQGLYELAKESYIQAIEIDPDDLKPVFRLAFRYDMEGDESAAIDYYRQIISTSPAYVSALLNLAVLYEDKENFDKAAACIEQVLIYFPNHKKATLMYKDIESSKTMCYDEDKENKKTKRNQILETPISDFELSVRSRNCLRKMKIITIGDLLRITEPELLSYKNFGETSLKEIKAILLSKNLRLGMALEEVASDNLEEIDDISPENQELLGKPVDDMQLSIRARRCLQKLNIHTIGDIARKTEAELLGVKNFGVTSLNEIKKSLNSLGLKLRSLD